MAQRYIQGDGPVISGGTLANPNFPTLEQMLMYLLQGKPLVGDDGSGGAMVLPDSLMGPINPSTPMPPPVMPGAPPMAQPLAPQQPVAPGAPGQPPANPWALPQITGGGPIQLPNLMPPPGGGMPPSAGMPPQVAPAVPPPPPIIPGVVPPGPAPAPGTASPVAPTALEQWLATWGNSEQALNWPFPRGGENTGFENVMAGVGNFVGNLPQNAIHAASGLATSIGLPDVTFDDVGQFFTVPEGEVAAGAPPAGGAGFVPGLRDTTRRIQGVENATGNAAATNPASSAMGNSQALRSTWLDFMGEVYPDALDVMGAEKALALRAEPQYAEEFTSWYAGKAVDELDRLNLPATDTNVYLHHHFGPEGMKGLLTADPNASAVSVLGQKVIDANPQYGSMTAGQVINFAEAKMGELEPQPPGARPVPTLPDFTEANKLLDASAPKPVDPVMLQNAMFAQTLAGLGQGLGMDMSSGAELFGNMAAGASAGLTSAKDMELRFHKDFQDQVQAYNAGRAGVSQNQEVVLNEGRNLQSATEWQSGEDMRQFTQGVEAEAAAEAAKRGFQLIEATGDTLWYQQGGEVRHISLKDNEPFKQVEDAIKAMGGDHPMAEQMKIDLMIQNGQPPIAVQMEVMRSLVRNGMAPTIFGDSWGEALRMAEETIPPSAMGDPKLYQEHLEEALVPILTGLAMQRPDPYAWLGDAARLGSYGAAKLIEGGTFNGQPMQ